VNNNKLLKEAPCSRSKS